MRTRQMGIKGIQAHKKQSEKLKQIGEVVQTQKIENVQRQLTIFKDSLEKFAKEHKSEINTNPMFRQQFHDMCLHVGVDPLASNKGFWAQLLGVGDFYYELSVQIIHICISTRKINGGLICVSELLNKLRKMRGKNAQLISDDDIKTSIDKICILGDGYRLLKFGNQKMVISVPVELNNDHSLLLDLAQKTYYVTFQMILDKYHWTYERIKNVIDLMMREELVWVDTSMGHYEDSYLYWFPSLFCARDEMIVE